MEGLENLHWWEWRPWPTWLTMIKSLMSAFTTLLAGIIFLYIERKRHGEPLPPFWRARFWNRKDCEQRRRKLNWWIWIPVIFVATGVSEMSFWVMAKKFDWSDGYLIKRPWSEVYEDREIKEAESDEGASL